MCAKICDGATWPSSTRTQSRTPPNGTPARSIVASVPDATIERAGVPLGGVRLCVRVEEGHVAPSQIFAHMRPADLCRWVPLTDTSAGTAEEEPRLARSGPL